MNAVDPVYEDLPLRKLIRDLLEQHPEWDDDAVAAAALGTASSKAALVALVHPLATWESINVRRSLTRQEERKAFKPTRKVDPTAQRKGLLDKGFLVPGKGLVRWGDATVEDHEARIVYLESMRGAIAKTVAQHQEAIDEIRSHGVSCLYEIEVAA